MLSLPMDKGAACKQRCISKFIDATFLLQSFQRTLEDLCSSSEFPHSFSDILFRLDDGAISAHKPILMARCDMMLAMFTHEDFVESSARVVKFPGKEAPCWDAQIEPGFLNILDKLKSAPRNTSSRTITEVKQH